ncbi:MAG: dephospho-CoA kinase [Myxococcota bacterium]
MTRIVGLSGGIGSGKSTVASLFEKLGATLVDADAIVHELQAPGMPILDELASAFGSEILRADGSLDRAALADRVFRDDAQRQRLNDIVHPAVGIECDRRVAEGVAAGSELLVLDIPLLFEGLRSGTGYAARRQFFATVLVWTCQSVQIERTMTRDGCTEEQAMLRIRAQMPLSEKRELADYVIENDGSREETESQVRALFETLRTAEP